MKRRSFLFGLSAFGLAACSPAPAPVSSSPNDPSNPNAAEGVNPTPTASAPPAMQASQPDPHAGHAGHAGHAAMPATSATANASDAGAGATVYVCPMHPEVTSTQPGSVCPKCNMKLVPKK